MLRPSLPLIVLLLSISGYAQEKKTVPVVFHVVHNYQSQYLSVNAVQEELNGLNSNFAGRIDTSEIVPQFRNLTGDARIEFKLATRNPEGGWTSGLVRHRVEKNAFEAAELEDFMKTRLWDVKKYLNIVVVPAFTGGPTGSPAGHSYYPWVCTNVNAVYIAERVNGIDQPLLTRLVGHWLGLFNLFSSNDPCNTMQDSVADTPAETFIQAEFCDLDQKNGCGELENVQNFMHSYYAFCSAMFTRGQGERMHHVLETQPCRPHWRPENLDSTGTDYDAYPDTLFRAAFSKNPDDQHCPGIPIQFYDESEISANQWKWHFPGGTPEYASEQNPTVVYNQPGTYDVSLTVYNGTDSLVLEKPGYVLIEPIDKLDAPYRQDFEAIDPSLDPDFEITDEGGTSRWRLNSTTGYSGSHSAFIARNTKADETDDLTTESINYSVLAAPVLSFRFAYAPALSGSSDMLEILVSSDCGVTYVKKRVLKGTLLQTAPSTDQDFIPNSTQWKEYLMALNNFGDNGYRVRFRWISGGGSAFYLDDINIQGADAVADLNSFAKELQVTPNPATDHTILSIDLEQPEIIQIELTDLAGRPCWSSPAQHYTAGPHELAVPRNDLAAGVYLLRIWGRMQAATTKVCFR